jgi:hypothetical protein
MEISRCVSWFPTACFPAAAEGRRSAYEAVELCRALVRAGAGSFTINDNAGNTYSVEELTALTLRSGGNDGQTTAYRRD